MNIERLKNLVRGIIDPDDAREAMRMLADAKSYSELRDENVKLKKQIVEEQEDHIKVENALARSRLRAENERDIALTNLKAIDEQEFLRRVDAIWQGKEEVMQECLSPIGLIMVRLKKQLDAALAEAASIKQRFSVAQESLRLVTELNERRARADLNKEKEVSDLELTTLRKIRDGVCEVLEGRADIDALRRMKEELIILRARQPSKPESQVQAELLADMHRVNDAMLKAKATDDSTRVSLGLLINDAAIRHKVYNQMKSILEKK